MDLDANQVQQRRAASITSSQLAFSMTYSDLAHEPVKEYSPRLDRFMSCAQFIGSQSSSWSLSYATSDTEYIDEQEGKSVSSLSLGIN